MGDERAIEQTGLWLHHTSTVPDVIRISVPFLTAKN
jgi:hypothetical protein